MIKEKLKQIREIEKRSKNTKLNSNDINHLIEIDCFAEKNKIPELRERITRAIINLEKAVPAKEIILKEGEEGEIKELDEETFVKKRRNNIIELIIQVAERK